MGGMLVIKPLKPDDGSLTADLLALFNEAYNSAPWGETTAENAATIAGMLREVDGWRGVVALDQERVVGVAQGSYGRILDGDLERLNAIAAASLTDPLFEFHQLVVSPSARGRRLGTRMHDELMAGLQYDAILETHPEAREALRLYRSRGWIEQGTLEVVPGANRTIMTLVSEKHR
jgi:ribosomal protein S18 acetylase RimI-like enzyme